MGHAFRSFSLLQGGEESPLREGICRRVGCVEAVEDLCLCVEHLADYRRMRGRREQELAVVAVANVRALQADSADEPENVEPEWLWALGEHLAAHGVDPETAHDENLLRRAVLDALGDYAEEYSDRGHLKAVQ